MKDAQVVHVAARYPPALGGMERVAREVAERTAAAGLRVAVLTTGSGVGQAPAPAGGVPVARCAALDIAHTPVAPGLLPALLRVAPGALLHVHVAQPLTPELAALAAALRGLDYLVHFHLDVGPSGPLGLLLPAYKRAMLGPVLRHAARVVAYTEDDAALLAERHGVAPARLEVIPGGVQAAPPLPRAPASEERILFVGRLAPQKQLPVLLEALARLAARGRPTRLRIAGEGEEAAALRERARALGLAARVDFLGRVEGRRLDEERRDATVLALPSEREAMGLVLAEAMAASLPVVAADIPGVRRVVRDGVAGLLAPPAPGPFAAALERVLADPALRRRLAVAGPGEAEAYRWERLVPRWLELYRRLGVAPA